MRTIEERAKEYVKRVYDGGYTDVEIGFIRGAQSEHKELTRWNSLECPPDNRRQVLLKVKTSFIGKIYYKVGSFIDGDYCESYSGRSLKTECLGWREIHE